MSTDERLMKLEAENAELKARLEKLEQPKAEAKPFIPPPYQPIDYTDRASMDRRTMAEFAAAASGGGIANDAWRSTQPSSIIPKEEVKPAEQRGVPSEGGWQRERPLEGPPGVKIIDEMMAAEDEIWRRDRAKQFGQVPRKEDK